MGAGGVRDVGWERPTKRRLGAQRALLSSAPCSLAAEGLPAMRLLSRLVHRAAAVAPADIPHDAEHVLPRLNFPRPPPMAVHPAGVPPLAPPLLRSDRR